MFCCKKKLLRGFKAARQGTVGRLHLPREFCVYVNSSFGYNITNKTGERIYVSEQTG